MKIAYLDLNETHIEDYSVAPARYGGGAVFARWAKESLADFHIFSNPRSFDNLRRDENMAHCHSLTDEERNLLRNGQPVKTVIPSAEDFDLFVYHQVNLFPNLEGLKAKQCCWAVGFGEHVHPQIENLLLYSTEFQVPVIRNPNCRIYSVKIGKPIPNFVERPKEDFIFQCTRHTPTFGSIHVAYFCRRQEITGIFAGPIDPGYDLLAHIDNRYTYYLGIIPEDVKLDYTARARLCTMIHSWSTPFNLSAVESLGYGTPVAATQVGFWRSFIRHGENGFLVNTFEELEEAWALSRFISQKTCHASALPYSEMAMVESFRRAFENVFFKV